ncbi:hypothetical protein V8F06_008766 [Rhypophila decipiens]
MKRLTPIEKLRIFQQLVPVDGARPSRSRLIPLFMQDLRVLRGPPQVHYPGGQAVSRGAVQRDVQSRDSKVKALENEVKDLRQKPKISTTVASNWEDVWFICKFAVRGGGWRFGRRSDYADSVATSWLALLLTSPRLLEESMTGTACEMMIAHAIVGELIGAGVLPIHLVVVHVDMVVVVAGVPSCVLLITREMTREMTQDITQEVKLRLWRGGRRASEYRRGSQIPRMGFSFWLGGGEGAPRPKEVMKYGQRSWRAEAVGDAAGGVAGTR